MKRLLLVAVAVTALVPATALAHHGRHHRHHHRAHATRTFAPRTDNSNIGTVTSFDGTTLVITTNGGSAVTGTVTDATRISCDSAGGAAAARSARLRDHGNDQGDDNGNDQADNNDQGDDNGNDQADANDQGDDNGNDNAQGNSCSTADLTPGAVVHRARLELTGTGAMWEKVQLVK